MTRDEALYHYCLRLGDDALILGHRLAELCSQGPFLEEDLALTNIALDYTGRAQAYYRHAAALEGRGRTEDDLVYRRPERQFYNHLLTEQPNRDFAFTMVRQFLFSAYDVYLLEELAFSSDATLAAIAGKAIKETRYHLNHASDWMKRLGKGTDESKRRMQQALDSLWAYTGELFEMDDVDLHLLPERVACDLHTIRSIWQRHVHRVLMESDLQLPKDDYMQTGSRKGIHSEHLGHLLSEMQYLVRAYPDAPW